MMWLRPRRPPVADLPTVRFPTPVDHAVPGWRTAALALRDGAALGETLATELRTEMARRSLDIAPSWSLPALSDLRVRRDNLPEQWIAGRNLFLIAPGSSAPPPPALIDGTPTTDSIVAIGANVQVHQAHTGGVNALLAIGDGARLPFTSLNAASGSTVLIGECSTSTFMAAVDGRNGGRVLIGADAMWASGVRIVTDDMHAIRDRATGKRLNRRGGSVVVEPHVWLCEQVMLMADCRIGHDTVVGAGSLVKSVELPAHAVCAGQPLRTIRTGTTWSREDLP